MSFLKTMALGAIIDVDATKAIQNVGGLSGMLKTASKSLTTIGGGLSSFGRTMLKVGAIGVGLTAGIGLLASQAATFEQQMSSVRAVMLDVSGKHIPALKRKAEELALATTFSATQVGQGMELMARAGFKTGEIIEGIGGILAVAAAEGIELAEASSIVSSTLKGMGLAADQAGRVADVLAVAATSTKSSISTLGVAMANASSTAKTFKLSLEDTVASVALMQDIGIDAAESGTALKTMLLRLAAPSEKVKEKMNSLGFAVQNAKGDMLPFQQVVGNLAKTLPKLGGNMKQAAFLTDLFGLRGIKAGIALADAFKRPDSNLADLIEKLKDAKGSAKAMADLKLDNLRDQIGLVGSSVEVLSSRLFGPFLGIAKQGVKDLVVLLNEVAKGLAGEGTSGAAQFGKGMATAMGMMRDGAVAVRTVLIPVVKAMDGAFGGKTGQAVGIVTVALIAMAVAATPVVLAIGAIAVALGGVLTAAGLAIAGIMAVGWPVVLGTMAAGFLLVQIGVMAVVGAGAALLTMFAFMRANGGSLGRFLQMAWVRVAHGWEVFRDVFMASWGSIQDAFMPPIAILRSAWGDLMGGLQQDSDTTSRTVVAIAESLAGVAVFTLKMIAGFLFWGAIIVKVGSLFVKHVAGPFIRFLAVGTLRVFKFVSGFVNGFNDISKSTDSWIVRTGNSFVDFVDLVDKSMTSAVNSILDGLIKVTDAMIGMVQNNPIVRLALEKAGISQSQAFSKLFGARNALAGSKITSLGVSDSVRDVQKKLKESLNREARARASATSPEVSAQFAIEDKRTICIQNELTMDGREVAFATKEAEVELTERAGFSVTPWQKRQILERGATVLNPT